MYAIKHYDETDTPVLRLFPSMESADAAAWKTEAEANEDWYDPKIRVWKRHLLTASDVKYWNEGGGIVVDSGKRGHFFDRKIMKLWRNRMSDFKVLCDRDQAKAYENFSHADGSPIEPGEHVFFMNRKTGTTYRVRISDGSIYTA